MIVPNRLLKYFDNHHNRLLASTPPIADDKHNTRHVHLSANQVSSFDVSEGAVLACDIICKLKKPQLTTTLDF